MSSDVKEELNDENAELSLSENEMHETGSAPADVKPVKPRIALHIKTTIPEKWKTPLLYAAVLMTFFTAAAVFLGVTDALTRNYIDSHSEREHEAAKLLVFPGAYFEKVAADTAYPVKEVYVAFEAMVLDDENQPEAYEGFLGYAVRVAPRGFGGEIDMMVGIGSDKSVVKAVILSMNEIAGIGDRALSQSFLEQYTGARIGLRPGNGVNTADGITGATVTSNAVTAGVALALDAVDRIGNLPDAPDYITEGEPS
jgi:electron transport complex protein RnfG